MSVLGIEIDAANIIHYVVDYGTHILFALLIFFIGKWAAHKIVFILEKSMEKAKMDEILISFLGNIAYALILAFVIIAALSKLGLETTSIAAVFAAAGLAIGLSLQSSLSNFAAGIMIIIFRPFKKGDFVELSSVSGTVRAISIFTTTLKTGDNKTVIIPNARITSNELTNYSTESERRIDLIFGCGYDDDIKKAKSILNEVVTQNPKVLETPAPLVAVSELADSSVNFVVRPWVKSEDYWSVRFQLIEAVKEAFDANDISIPFPQRDIHLYQHDKV